MPTITRQVSLEEIPESWREGLGARPHDQIAVRLDVVGDAKATRRERVFQAMKGLRRIGRDKGPLSQLIRDERERLDGRNIPLNL